jgi:hypothetical protein
VPFVVEVIVDRAVNRGEPLQNSLRGPSVQRCFPVTTLRDEALVHFSLVINGAPEIVLHGNRIAGRNPSRIAIVIFTKTSSRCQRRCRKFRIAWTRLRRISAAKIVPNRFPQNRIVLCVISVPRSCSHSSTFRSDSG